MSGSITVNGNEVAISAGETEVNVKSTTTIEQDASYWADYGYTDENDQEVGEWIETTAATLRVQLGVDGAGFLGASEIEISELEFTPYVPAEGTESITASGLSNVNGVDGESDGLMHYWANSATVTEAVHDLTEDTYTIEYSDASGDWWGFQIFWMLTPDQLNSYGLEEGSTYTLTFDLDSSVAGSIKVVGDIIALNVGSNSISVTGTVNSTNTDHATFHIWMGAEGEGLGLISAAKVVISNITFEEYVAPEEWAHSYSVDFKTLTLKTQADGERGDSYGESKGDLCRWAIESGWGDSAGGISTISDEIDTTNGYYSCTLTIPANEVSYAYQLFYHVPDDTDFVTGTSYSVRITIDVSTDVTCSINGVTTELTSGTQTVTVLSDHSEASNDADFVFIIGGGTSDLSLTLKLSEITFLWN